MTDNKQYPPLPASFGHVHSDGNYCQDMEQSHESWPIDIYTAVQMRAYVDADRAMRAAQAAPAAWRHSRTYSVYEAAEQVPIADGDEWAEPLYLHPPEAPASQDAEDAARYRWLRARWGRMADEYDGESDQLVAIRESDSSFKGWDVDPVILDLAIDAARAAKEGDQHG